MILTVQRLSRWSNAVSRGEQAGDLTRRRSSRGPMRSVPPRGSGWVLHGVTHATVLVAQRDPPATETVGKLKVLRVTLKAFANSSPGLRFGKPGEHAFILEDATLKELRRLSLTPKQSQLLRSCEKSLAVF